MPDYAHQINPFAAADVAGETDRKLVIEAAAGGHQALEDLVIRHQPWIYNLAFRMVMVREEAEDVTQEVLVKIITKLATYDSEKAAFRTWLYRIVTNHVINMKARGLEAHITDLESYYSFVAQVPDREPDDSPETGMVAQDLAISCVMGTLLCLDRRSRVVFILAVGFGVNDEVGSEILDVSRDTFRQILSRARRKLKEYMGGNCSLLNPDAPCHCRKKVQTFIESGALSSDRLSFRQEQGPRLRDLVGQRMERFDTEIYDDFSKLLREHPFYDSPDAVAWLRETIAGRPFREIFQLDTRDEGAR